MNGLTSNVPGVGPVFPPGTPIPVRLLSNISTELAAGVAPGFWLERVPEQAKVFRFGFNPPPMGSFHDTSFLGRRIEGVTVDTGFSFRLSACVFLGALLRRRGYRVSVSCRGRSISALVRL